MAKNKIEDLRDHLFEVIERLKDQDEPFEIERANTIATVAQVIVNSAKAEVDYLKVVGGTRGSNFMPVDGRKELSDGKA